MKIRSKIYLIIGWLLIGLNLIVAITDWHNVVREVKGEGGIAFLIGYNFFIIIGVLLISKYFKIKKKMKLQEEVEKIENIGTD